MPVSGPFSWGLQTCGLRGARGLQRCFVLLGQWICSILSENKQCQESDAFGARVCTNHSPTVTLVLVPVSARMATIHLSLRHLSISSHCRKRRIKLTITVHIWGGHSCSSADIFGTFPRHTWNYISPRFAYGQVTWPKKCEQK